MKKWSRRDCDLIRAFGLWSRRSIRNRIRTRLAAKPHRAVKDRLPSRSDGSPGKPVTSAVNLDPRLAAALARGEIARQKLAADEGGSISSAHAARLLGISKGTVLYRWRTHRLVAWKRGKTIRFPVWQFSGSKTLDGIEAILQVFRSNDQRRVMLSFLAQRHSLGGRRPLDLLREDQATKVIQHAQGYFVDNTW